MDLKSLPIPHVNIEVLEHNVQDTFSAILRRIKPDWKNELIRYEVLEKGVSAGVLNTMIKCYHGDESGDVIMIRIPHVELSALIPRSNEVKAMKYFHSRGCAPNVLATFNNGFCYQYIYGEILSYVKVKEEPIWRKVAEMIAGFHSGSYEDETLNKSTRSYVELTRNSLNIYPDKMLDPEMDKRFRAEMPTKAAMTAEFDAILDHVTKLGSPMVLCHNDTRGENIIWNSKTGTLHFVDWEAVGYNYQALEIAVHFTRLAGLNPPDYSMIPGKDFQTAWIRTYLRKYYELTGRDADDVTNVEVERLYIQAKKFYLVVLLFAAIVGPAWETFFTGIPPGQIDLMGFTVNSMQEYYKQKDVILALPLPD